MRTNANSHKSTNPNEHINDPYYKLSFENSKLTNQIKHLKRAVQLYQEEIEKYRTPPLLISEVVSVNKEKRKAVVKLPNQSNFLVNICQFIKNLQPGDMVVNEQKTLVIIDKIEKISSSNVENFVIMEKPEITWNMIGGLDDEVQKLREVVEMPLLKPYLFEQIGIDPPKGILLHGPPGTGKTLLARSLAHSTNATFIQIVGSELVQKYIGEGAKLVKELFALARKKAPCIIFIDEIDSIGSKRIENGTSGEREVQRTFMQLLAEIDGFAPLDDVKIIGATNRLDVLDEALTRPGRLEKHIHVSTPSEEGRLSILKIHTQNMPLAHPQCLKHIANKAQGYTGALLKALVTEAGYIAIRNEHDKVTQEDFKQALERTQQPDEFMSSMVQ